jgi:hypothetical protein
MVPTLNLGAIYPLSELLTDFPPDSNVPLLVDVGGGNGTDLELFLQALPQPYNEVARLIFQDLPAVIDEAKKTKSFAANVEPMVHDFFTPQPVKGARAYFLNHVLHDWPDARVRQILKNLRPAIKPGFSKLLLGENVLPGEKVPPVVAALDLEMLAVFGAKERTRQEWEEVLKSAGFRIVKIWWTRFNLIEVEPAAD